ncbi:glycosyltransferase family 2 protein [Romboutsia hominis]|uniref:glycosyltransferase family 2 protein n=1 Tax=Romboutsia hominis TaxID=1507512 RepID=UPI001F05BD39|nr:glycosyltransferase family 2 protein [Romboutsia hominis]MCH1968436.1 glycosyltransferase [Romboutsia hominis]
MNEPLVSIITPVYNAERFLGDTIKSIQNQTYKNWELVLVDDCSKDKSSDMIKEFQANDDRIRYIKLEKNSGASVSRNTGIKNAKGRFIAFVDSDDIWQPEKLKIQIEYMLENKLGFTFTSYRYMKEDGRLTKKVAKAPKKINYKGLLKIQ